MNILIPTIFHRAAATLGLTALLGLSLPLQAGPLVRHTSPKSTAETFSTAAEHPWYLGTFNTGVKTSDVYTEGNISLVIPLWSSLGLDDSLGGGTIFLTPYASLGEQGELATSVGLGWRYLFNDQPLSALTSDTRANILTEGFYVGANVFVDNLRTQFNNDFWQLGIGAEIGTRYFEVRGNYYLPFDGSQKLAERSSSTQRYRSQSSSRSTHLENSASSNLFATGHTIQQDVNFATTAVTTTRTTTTTSTVKTITSLYEEGMEGWDLETAFLIPGVDKYFDLSLLVGYYSFDNQPFGPQRGPSGKTEGWKAGVEIRPVPAIVLTGMWYEDEGLTGSDWVAGVGLQIPLGKDWKDAFKPRRRHLVERLGEPVARQNAAIKTAHSYDVDQQVSHQSTTKTAVRRQVVSQSSQRITIAEDIVFVNNGDAIGNGIQAGSVGGNGTAENPVDTIQAGADIAGSKYVNTSRIWNVYTQYTSTPYVENVITRDNTNFISSFTPIHGTAVTNPQYPGAVIPAATFGGNTPRPVLNGGILAQRIGHLGVAGYHITGGVDPALLNINIPVPSGGAVLRTGIGVHDVENSVITDNVIRETRIGIGVLQDSTTGTTLISRNVVQSPQGLGYVGIGVITTGDHTSPQLEATISENTLTGGNSGVLLRTHDRSQMRAVVTNNDISNINGSGVFAYAQGGDDTQRGSRLLLTATMNNIYDTNAGIDLNAIEYATINSVILSNKLQDIEYDAINLSTSGGTETSFGGSMDSFIAYNDITAYNLITPSNGLNVLTEGFSVIDVEFYDNFIDQLGGSAVLATSLGGNVNHRGSSLYLRGGNNTIRYSERGFNLYAGDFSNIGATIQNNNFYSVVTGIDAVSSGGSELFRGAKMEISAYTNTFDLMGDGIKVTAAGYSDVEAILNQNTFNDVFMNAVTANSSGGADINRGGKLNLSLNNNTVNNTRTGLAVVAGGFSDISVTSADNTFSNVLNGIFATAQGGSLVASGSKINLSSQRDVITGFDENDTVTSTTGILVDTQEYASMYVDIRDSVIRSFHTGISAYAENTSVLDFTPHAQSNTITDTYTPGFIYNSTGSPGGTILINNIIYPGNSIVPTP